MSQRHDAQYSPEVVEILVQLCNNPNAPVEGLIFDPFAGLGKSLDEIRDDAYGLDIEPEFARGNARVVQGSALEPSDYPDRVGAIVTSPCYGNRMADQYLGAKCPQCHGAKVGADQVICDVCYGTGRDRDDQKTRFGYAISLGREVSDDSAGSLHFHNGALGSRYRVFHDTFLRVIADVLDPGPRRFVLNMKDHYRTTTVDGVKAQRRQYVCHWWLKAAHAQGFRLVSAIPAYTQGIGFGANMQTGKADHEMVFVFDLVKAGQ